LKPFTYVLARFYEARANRAFRRYLALDEKAEKLFKKVGL